MQSFWLIGYYQAPFFQLPQVRGIGERRFGVWHFAHGVKKKLTLSALFLWEAG
jgi:hypothetical protein